MKKKIFCLFLTALFCINPLSGTAKTEAAVPYGYTAISTAEQLVGITNMSGKYMLTNNIDLTGKKWVPLSTLDDTGAFTGIFDGNGYTISNLSGTNGLFGTNTGTIKNVTLDSSCSIKWNGSPACTSIGAIAASNKGTIENCVNHGSLSGSAIAFIGGIAGSNGSTGGTIKYCVNTGSVRTSGVTTRDSGLNAGGICGYMFGTATIDQCWNQGEITAISNTTKVAYAGGITGQLSSTANVVSNTYNTGKINAEATKSNAGAGGIAGKMVGANIKTSYNTGSVTVKGKDAYSEYCFAMAGANVAYSQSVPNKGTYTNCYYLENCYETNTRNAPVTAGTTVCTAAQLRNKTTFSGFDFTNIWMIDGGSTYRYPVLRKTHSCSHSYQEKTNTATCTAAGIKTLICSYCDDQKQEASAALGHSWNTWTVQDKPTYIKSGTERRTCSRCSTYEENFIPATGQTTVDAITKTFSKNSVTMESVPADISTAFAAYYNGKMVFVQLDHTGSVQKNIYIPEDIDWDLLKLFFLTDYNLPISQPVEYTQPY